MKEVKAWNLLSLATFAGAFSYGAGQVELKMVLVGTLPFSAAMLDLHTAALDAVLIVLMGLFVRRYYDKPTAIRAVGMVIGYAVLYLIISPHLSYPLNTILGFTVRAFWLPSTLFGSFLSGTEYVHLGLSVLVALNAAMPLVLLLFVKRKKAE